eukprot:RCo000138
MGCFDDLLGWAMRWPYTAFVEDIILCAIVYGISQIATLAEPTCRGWSANDGTLDAPFTKETVPGTLQPVMSLLVPLVALLVVRLLFCGRIAAQLRSPGLYVAALEMAQALSMDAMMINSMKIFQGRLRPDWFARLAKAGYSTDPTNWQDLCGVPALRDGRMSFPSGHSGLMFASCGVLCMQIMAITHALVPGHIRYWKVLLSLFPFVFAAWFAGTRTLNYRHNYDDISVGAALGLCCSVLFHHMYFPPLWQPNCEYPHPRPSLRGELPASAPAGAVPLSGNGCVTSTGDITNTSMYEIPGGSAAPGAFPRVLTTE